VAGILGHQYRSKHCCVVVGVVVAMVHVFLLVITLTNGKNEECNLAISDEEPPHFCNAN
jgi:hypothetical protein